MSSKQVTDRQKSADSVIAIGLQQAGDISNILTPMLEPLLSPGESMPDVALMTRLLCRLLGQSKDQMVNADHAHAVELGDDPAARQARDEAAERLYDSLVSVRDLLTGMFGGVFAGQMMHAPTPRDPVVLERFAGEVVEKLGKAVLPAPKVPGSMLDIQGLIADLGAKRNELAQKNEGVVQEGREAQATLDVKNAAIAVYDERFGPVAGWLERMLELVGKGELAGKVRPSGRKSGQVESEGTAESPAP